MFAGNPAYTDERMKHFLENLPYFHEQLEDKHVTRLLLWEEYRKENPGGYGKSQFFYHLKQNLVAQKQVAVLRNTYKTGGILMIDFAGDKACRQGYKVSYFTMQRLSDQMRLARLEGKELRSFEKMSSLQKLASTGSSTKQHVSN